MWVPEETVNEVRERVNIVDVISQYVQLNKRGKNYFGYCPFHEERTPSFSVEDEEQFFHCFSCKRGGTVFNFIMEIDGLTYPESIMKVAEIAGVSIDDKVQGSIQDDKPKTKKDLLVAIYEQAKNYYNQVLTITESGEKALNYLLDRGLTKETIETFQLGYSPSQSEALYDYLSNLTDFDDDLLKESGLFNENDGKLYDRFSNRIIFPIRSAQGKTIAFSGRDFQPKERQTEYHVAKYLNSPETEIFNKSVTLFNLDLAKPDIRRNEEVFLFEGYMDVIAAYQAGVPNGIASMGTSLTALQIQQIEKLTDHVIIAYDGDRAGSDATKRAIDLLSEDDRFDIDVVSFPKDSDPDDFIQDKGAEAFQQLLTHSRKKSLGFLMSYYRKDVNLQNESEQTNYIEKVLREMVRVPSAIEREYYFKSLAEEFNFSIDTLKQEFQTYLNDYMTQSNRQRQEQRQQKQPSQQQKPAIPELTVVNNTNVLAQTTYERAENIILYRLLQFPTDVQMVLNQFENFHFLGVNEQSLYILFADYYDPQESNSVSEFINKLDSKELVEKVSELRSMTMSASFDPEEIVDCVHTLNSQKSLEDQLEDTKAKMKVAAQNGDTDLQNELLLKIVNILQESEQG